MTRLLKNDSQFRAQRLLDALQSNGRYPVKAMAVPPTVSESAGQTSRLTGGLYSSGATLTGGLLRHLGGTYASNVSAADYWGGGIGFHSNCDKVEPYIRAGLFEIFVEGLDGKIEYGGSFTSTGDKNQLIDFGSFATRHIEIYACNQQLSSVKVRPTYDIWPSRRRPRVWVIGDSYVALSGTLTTNLPTSSFCKRMGLYAGWDVCAEGSGGTGYTVGGGGVYSARMPNLSTYADDCDLIVITGGYNDAAAGAGTVQTAVTALIQQARVIAPTTPIIVIGPFTSTAKAVEIAAGTADAITAGDTNVYFIETTTTLPWQTGTVNAGDPKAGVLTFTGAIVAATSGTLTGNFAGTTGSYTIIFDEGTNKAAVTLTNGSTAVSWTGAVTAGTSLFYWFPSTGGNNGRYLGSGAVHLTGDDTVTSEPGLGHEYIGKRCVDAIAEVLRGIVS